MKQLLYILILFSLLSCEQEIIIDSSEYKPDVVVNSIINRDSSWVVNLHYSQSIFERGDFKPVENAIVHISVLRDEENSQEEIQEFTLDYQGNGRYTRDNHPNEGRNYRMSIEVDGKVVSAETYVPVVLNAKVRKREPGDTNITIDVVDHDSRENYYAYELVEDTNEVDPEEDYALGLDEEQGEDTGGNVTSVPTLSKNKGLISVVPIFTDNSGSIVVTVDDSSGNGSTDPTDPTISTGTEPAGNQSATATNYTLKVWAVSVDYYNYLLSVQQNNLPNSEKPHYNYYSNVVNGGGIFAGYNLKTFPVVIER